MTTLAVVPARGGSRGIPRKNLVNLGGRPLITWTIDAALESGVIDRLVVSSDDEEILDVAVAAGAETHLRPPALGGDGVHSVFVVLDVLEGLVEPPSRILMLLPTSPFRWPADIAGAMDLFNERQPPAVVSVTEFSKSLIHLRQMGSAGELIPVLPFGDLTAQRQGQPPLYLLNGSIYVSDPATLAANRTFHVPGALGFLMPPSRSLDIDSPSDLVAARAALEPRPLTL